jgi:hypothetical protein
MTDSELADAYSAARMRIDELEAALRGIVNDIEEYERINHISPSPGKPDCWQSVTYAKAVLNGSNP